MLTTANSSTLDDEALSKIKVFIDGSLDNFDFSNVVVKKPWGHEYLAYGSDKIAAWVLNIKKDNATSMHCHLSKQTILIVLAGTAKTLTLNGTHYLNAGDGLIINKRVFHTTTALSEQGVVLIEIENPPRKTDLVRLRDTYGRERKGYELQNEMCYDLSKYNYVYLSDSKPRKIGEMYLSIGYFENVAQVKQHFENSEDVLMVVLSGEMISNETKMFFGAGCILDSDTLKNTSSTKIIKPLKILNIAKQP